MPISITHYGLLPRLKHRLAGPHLLSVYVRLKRSCAPWLRLVGEGLSLSDACEQMPERLQSAGRD